jgi:hypothetical protein
MSLAEPFFRCPANPHPFGQVAFAAVPVMTELVQAPMSTLTSATEVSIFAEFLLTGRFHNN